MSEFAQTNYSQQLGTGPYSIGEAGCFLTSFCNLLTDRFSLPIDPPTLNNFFNAHHNFIDVDGDNTKDDLAWGTISAYNGEVIVVGTGSGWPDSNDAIVKFQYVSPRTGHKTTHFCLVKDHAAKTIVDSWDGVVKHSNTYGTPVAYAKYERHRAQVVVPPPAAPAPTFTIENIPRQTKELAIDAKLWDLNQRSWPALASHPVGSAGHGTKFETEQIAHHVVHASYYLPLGSASQGYNTADCKDPEAAAPAPAPTPVPTPAPAPEVPKSYTTNTVDGIRYEAFEGDPRVMYVSKPEGAEKWSFANVAFWRDFKSVEHVPYGTEVFIVGEAHHPIPPKGASYLMIDPDFGDFKKTGKVTNLCGFNVVDLSETKPPVIEQAKPAPAPVAQTAPAPAATPTPVPVTVATPPAASTSPVAWQNTYVPFPKPPVHYIAVRDLTVVDLAGKQPNMPLKKYDPTVSSTDGKVGVWGTVYKDGVEYYRLRTNNDPAFSFWYCVPKLDPVSHLPLLLVLPSNPLVVPNASKMTTARDALELFGSRIEQEALQLIETPLKMLRVRKK